MLKKIGFWKVSEPYGFLSNWYLCKFTFDGIEFCSSEQALMYMKASLFDDEEIKKEILATTNQSVIKALGRKVKNYNDRPWGACRYSTMVDILYAKFSQNEKLKVALLATGDAELYEASPYDAIWGIGSSDVNAPMGLNLLGQALQEVREKLKN